MNLLAVIAQGHADLSDLCYLVAVILFAILAVWAAFERSIGMVILGAALAFTALGLLVL